MTRLYITFENGRTVDLGPASRPHDGIGTARNLLQASQDVAYVEWRTPDSAGRPSFEATRVGLTSFGWRTPTMPGWAFASLVEPCVVCGAPISQKADHDAGCMVVAS